VSDISGRGLGLSAVRNAANALGGTVSVSSQLGTGTKIVFHFPVLPASNVHALTRSRPSTTRQGLPGAPSSQ
jgi:two-component system chemotaxis sensor kinase CheA